MTFQRHDIPDIATLAALPRKGRTIIFETVYGSKLYGCDMEGSDHDIRGVYLPGLHDFLSEVTPKPEKMDPLSDPMGSDDILFFPIGEFIDQVIRMKINCVEIFFAALAEQRRGVALHPAMELILAHKDVLITSDADGFFGHARQRASSYIEGDDLLDSNLQANLAARAILEQHANHHPEGPATRIMDIPGLAEAIADHPSIKRIVNGRGEPVLMIGSRQLPENARLAEALRMVNDRIARYQSKNLDADPQVMFKDLCTALRMMETSAELMLTGEIAFPRPRAEHYRSIRRGEIAREAILADIDVAQSQALGAIESGVSPLLSRYEQGEHVPVRNALIAQLRFLALKALQV